MIANPIIRRYRFSQLRPQQAWVFGGVYVAVVLLVLFINSSIYRYGQAYLTATHLYKGLFVQFAILEIFLLWLLCPANCSTVVAREIADKSFDFFRMLPLSAAKKAVGILIGRNLFCLLVAGVNLAFCLLFAFGGELSGQFIVQMLMILAALTLALNLLALMFSILNYKKTKNTSIPVLLVIGLFAFGPVMGGLIDSIGTQKLETTTAYFYTFEAPVLYLIAFCALFVAFWAYIGVLRRFTYEYEALFSRTGSGLFMLTYLVMLGGLFYVYLLEANDPDPARVFWMLGLLPAAVVPLFAIRGFDRYLETSRTAHRVEGLFGRLLIHSNLTGGLMLFVIWLAFAIAAGVTARADAAELLWLAMIAFSALLVIWALVETTAVWQPRNEKIGYLLGFLAVLYIVLPFILGGIFENEMMYLFSPLGVVNVFDSHYSAPILLMPIFFNLICLLPLGILIAKRYFDLVAIRTQIEHTQDMSPRLGS
ncbi:MAG TPA: hypothetical protein ENN97_09195 [Phycisphaerales bacterium]|nr:hypothetical protein [Phycisphaerales bacterium]